MLSSRPLRAIWVVVGRQKESLTVALLMCFSQVVGPSGTAAAAAGASNQSPAQRRQQARAQGLGGLHSSPPEGQGLGGLLGLNSPPLSPVRRAALSGMHGAMQHSLLGSGTGLADLAGAGAGGGMGGVGSPGGLILQGYGYGNEAEGGAGGGGNGGGGAALVFGVGLELGGFGSTGNLTGLLGLMQGGSGGLEGGLYEDLLPPMSGGGLGQQEQQQQQQQQGRGRDGSSGGR
jgi:hypothetical protein